MYVYMYVCMHVRVCMYVCMPNLIITHSDMVTNVHDTDICFCVLLLLMARIGQSQHCTSEYLHFSLKHFPLPRCCAIQTDSLPKCTSIW